MTKNLRTDQNLEPDITEDYPILVGMATKIYARFKLASLDRDDIIQDLCEYYCEAISKYPLKPRIIPKRPFVFNYINYQIMRMYQPQYLFEHKDIFPVPKVYSNDTVGDDSGIPSSERNPYLFENSYDLNQILEKYSMRDRIIIYYHFYLGFEPREIRWFTPDKNPVSQEYVNQLKITLQNDFDFKQLLKEH